MFLILLTVIIGIFCSVCLPTDLTWISLGFQPLILYAFYYINIRNKSYNGTQLIQISKSMILTMAYLLGVILGFNEISERLTSRVSESQHGNVVSIDAQVIGFPVKTDFGQKILIRSKKYKLQSYWPGKIELLPGQHWKVDCKLKMNIPVLSPGAYDPSYHSFLQGIDGGCQVQTFELIAYKPDFFEINRIQLRRWIDERRLESHQKSLILALLMGDQSGLGAQQKQLLRDSNTSHLFVVSGLHLSLAFIMFFGLSGLFGKLVGFQYWRPISDLQWTCGMIAAFVYAAICGFPIPTQRALIMLAVPFIFHIKRFSMVNTQAFWIAFLMVVLFDPLAILQFSSWLSFGAVGILLMGMAGRKPLKAPNVFRSANLFFRPQWLIAICLAPILWLMGQASNPASVIVNLIAIPMVSLLVLPTLILMLFSSLLDFNKLVFMTEKIMASLLEGLLILLDWGASLKTDYLPEGVSILIYSIFVLLVLLPPGLPGKTQTSLFMVFAFIVYSIWPANPPIGLNIYLLDVGQGQSVLVQQDNNRILIDTGPGMPNSGGAFLRVVMPFLNKHGAKKLDAVIYSHADSDHVSGLQFAPDHLQSPLWLFGEPGSSILAQCEYGQQWNFGALNVEILSPFMQMPVSGNRASCVVKIKSKDGCVLIPGDADKLMEYVVLDNVKKFNHCNILVASHHGSESSSSGQWLDRINPQLFLISAGRLNRFNHPSAQVIDKVEQRGIPWRSTQEEGSIWVQMVNEKVSVSPMVKQLFYWQ